MRDDHHDDDHHHDRRTSRHADCNQSAFNLNDKSGSSIVSRALDNRTPLDEDIISLFKDNPELEIVYAGAIYSDTETFIVRLNTWLEQASHNHENKNALQTIYDLFRNQIISEIKHTR